jgi:hypothetical protein
MTTITRFFTRRTRRPMRMVCLMLVVFGCSIERPLQIARAAVARDATQFPGASIVEKIQAAIQNCGSVPCEVIVPAGTYDSSAIRTWTRQDKVGAKVGVAIPSNVKIQGAGEGHTTIRVTRSAGDPPATLFVNADRPNRNIRISDMTIVWNDSDSQYNWVSILRCSECSDLELTHLWLEGNANKLVNLLDNTRVDVHDNTFLLRSMSYGHGDNALSVNRFDPDYTPDDVAGVVRNNKFIEEGDFRTFSMLLVCQSGLYVTSNTFENASSPNTTYATGIETGVDNTGHLPVNVRISENVFRGSSIAYGGLNDSEIRSNSLYHGNIYVALQAGTAASVGGLTIADNELHFGSIGINGLEHTITGRCTISHNRVFDGRIGTGSALTIHDIEVSDNLVRYSRDENGIDCNACSVIRGNIVREIGQNGAGDVHAGYLIGGDVFDVSDNLYIDEQHDYDAGTICSVAGPSSNACLTSGRSRWVLLQGGAWGGGWPNRTLFTERGNLLIHSFVQNSLLELEDDAPYLPAKTRYHLYRTTYNAFELNSASIVRFANNVAISVNGGFRHAAVQENGKVQIENLYGNVFMPYRCVGTCSNEYVPHAVTSK